MTLRNHRKRRLAFATVCATFSILLAACGRGGTANPIRVGADLPLTGGLAFWGESIKQGMELASEDYAKAHPGSAVSIVYEDNQGDPKNAITVMRKLISVDHVSVVVSSLTPLSKPLRSLAAELRTPVLGTVVASLNYGQENEWSFRDYPTPDQLGGLVADYGYNKLGLRRAVTLVVDDEYGNDSRKLFQDKFVALGGQVIGTDTVTQKDTDVRAQVAKLLAAKPDAVFLAIRENVLGISVRQFREAGFQGQILGINAFDSPVVWKTAGPSGDGVVFSSAQLDYEKSATASAFATTYRTRFSQEPNHTHAYGYVIGSYLLQLAAEAGGDAVKMRSLLASLDTDSIRGHIKMLPTRDVSTEVAVYKRVGDRNVLLAK